MPVPKKKSILKSAYLWHDYGFYIWDNIFGAIFSN